MGMVGTPVLNAKSLLRWIIRLLVIGFLGHALFKHWGDVTQLTFRDGGVLFLVLAAMLTFGAHVWAGVVWSWILGVCGHARPVRWATVTYLRTNVAKYLPGNVWHFVKRVRASQQREVPLGAAVLSVVLEAVLMVAAACVMAGVSFRLTLWHAGLVPLLLVIHPRWLNPILAKLAIAKAKTFGRFNQGATSGPIVPPQLQGYPLLPLAGELGFVALRAAGFVLCLYALHAPHAADIPAIIAAFSIAWVAGLVIPGSPGGVGVFEATALGLLQDRVPSGVVFGVVALYRLMSTGAEGLGGLVPERWSNDKNLPSAVAST